MRTKPRSLNNASGEIDSANPLHTTSVASSSNFGVPALDAPAGNIVGTRSVNKFGNNAALATGTTETIWDGSNLYTFPSTAAITHIRAAVDSATTQGMEVEVQGLDTNWDLSVFTHTLDPTNSTTEVPLVTAGENLRRVFRMKVKDASLADQNIWIGATGMTAATAKGIITAGNNQTLMAIYTVPNGKSAYITNYYASLNKDAGGGDPDVVVKMWHIDNTNGYAKQIKHILGIDSNASSYFSHRFDPYYKVTAKTDVYLDCTNLSGSASADVSAGFDLYLIDD